MFIPFGKFKDNTVVSRFSKELSFEGWPLPLIENFRSEKS